jgi:hypothetical protein
MCFLNQRLIFNFKIFNFILSLGQFNCDFMPLIFNGFMFGKKYVSMNLDLLFSLLHCHFQLIFLILQRVDVIDWPIENLFNFIDLEFHDVVLNQDFLLFLRNFIQVLQSHIVLQRKLLNIWRYLLFETFKLCKLAFHSSQIFVQPFHTFVQYLVLIFYVSILFLCFLDIFLEIFFLFKSSLTSRPCYLPFHQLNLILSII